MSSSRTSTLVYGKGWDQIRWVLRRAATAVSNEGVGSCLRRLGRRVARVLRGQTELLPFSSKDLDTQYRQWRLRHAPPPETIEAMRRDAAHLAYRPVISLVMQISDAQPIWVAKAIESVLNQAYPYWDLSLYGDSTKSRSIQPVIHELSAQDPRILLKELPREGTGMNGLCCLFASQAGDFVGVVGQHDELPAEALFGMAARMNEQPGLDLLYSDHDMIAPEGEYVAPFFKPDWSPDLLVSMNYVQPLCLFRRTAVAALAQGEERDAVDGLHDLLLRFTETTGNIGHIPRVLYHVRRDDNVIGGPSIADTSAIERAMRRRGEHGRVLKTESGRFHVKRELRTEPIVSILIPTRDHGALLEHCLQSIEQRTNYGRYEIIVLDNGSTESKTLRYLATIAGKWPVLRCPGPFNFSSINNKGAAHATGEYLLFLNNDVEVLAPDWLTAMVAEAQRPWVGAVGAKLLYPDGSIQHAGVVLGVNGIAGHAFRHTPTGADTYHGLADVVRNCSALTAACMLVPKSLFQKVQGFDERLRVEFNDIDLCLRIRQRGYRIVYTPEAVLYHYENATRKGGRSPEDEAEFAARWGDVIRRGDPYYNPHLTRSREDWSLNI